MYCKFCGKYSGKYYLCKDCFFSEDNFDEYEYEEDDEYYDDDDSYEEEDCEEACYCIACNNKKDNDGYLFCKSCYYKYKNKTLIFKVTKCIDFELLDNYYEGRYKCIDGHIVKSKAEREIDNYFFRNNIKHCYEPSLSIDGNEKHDLHPDFYLPDLNVYLEHWGKEEDEKYKMAKAYKVDKYRKMKITLICTHENPDSVDIESALKRKLNNYKTCEINYL